MKIQIFALLLVSFLTLKTKAQIPSISPQANIEKVTVYLNGAQITRSAIVQFEAGKTELVFKNLSPNLDKETIQFSTDKGLTIYSVSLRERDEPTDLNETQKAILKRIDVLKNAYASDSLDLAIAASEEDALYSNKEFRKYSELKYLDFKQNMDYYGQKTAELKRIQARLMRKMKGHRDSIFHIKKEAEKAGYLKEISGDVVVLVETSKSEKATVFLRYYVDNAGWVPSYDFRVKNVLSPMNLKWKASIFQATGENWNKVKLSLSNANPTLGGTVPVIKQWTINQGPAQSAVDDSEKNVFLRMIRGKVLDENSGEPIPFATIKADANHSANTDINGNFSISVPNTTTQLTFRSLGYNTSEETALKDKMVIYLTESTKFIEAVVVRKNDDYEEAKQGRAPGVNIFGKRAKREPLKIRNRQISQFDKKSSSDSEIPVVEAVQSAATVSFDIKEPYSIPENGKTITVDISEVEIKPDYQYVSVPKIDPSAYLTAQITDWQSLNLLPGKASIYYEDNFVGNTDLNPDGNQDTLVLSLGLDRQVSITRTRVKANSKKSFIGSNRFVSREYDIKIRNNKTFAIPLMVYDQLPVSSYAGVEIQQKRLDGDPILNSATGQLLWRLNLEPKQEKKIGFGYEVKFGQYDRVFLE